MSVPQVLRFVIKRNSTLPAIRLLVNSSLRVSLSVADVEEDPFDFSGATEVIFVMKNEAGDTVLSKAAIFESSSSSGILRYDWTMSDVSVKGEYKAEFKVGYPGDYLILPREGGIVVRIYEDIASS